MKSFFKFVLIAAVILLLSAFLAPILFKFLPFKFEKIFNRLIMIFTLTAVFLFVKIRVPSLEKYGLVWKPESLGFLIRAFWLGFLVLAVMSGIKIGLGASALSIRQLSVLGWAWDILEAFGAALLIGCIEEFFFRGFIYLSIKDKLKQSTLIALLATNIFYALLHFVSDKNPFIGPEPTFFDSLKLMWAPFMSFADVRSIWPGVVGLFIFGMILSGFFLRTRSLYASIGLHAGCVFFVKMDGYFVDNLSNSWVFGSSKSYDGLVPWCFLLMIWIISAKVLRIPQKTD